MPTGYPKNPVEARRKLAESMKRYRATHELTDKQLESARKNLDAYKKSPEGQKRCREHGRKVGLATTASRLLSHHLDLDHGKSGDKRTVRVHHDDHVSMHRKIRSLPEDQRYQAQFPYLRQLLMLGRVYQSEMYI